MAESYLATQADTRTFGEQIQRLLDDINRPDMLGVARSYLQDSMRYWGRKPFFFNDTDNTIVGSWAANTIYPQGSTIFFTNGGSTYVAVASNTGTSNTTTAPTFPTTIFTPPTGSTQFPPPTIGTAGTIDDNSGPPTGIRWLTVSNATSNTQTNNYWSQLSTVYNINRYTPPLDYVAPRNIQITPASYIYQLEQLSYPELQGLDSIRPSPVTSYPVYWAWYMQKIWLFPYPNGQYPLILSYRTAPQLASNTTDSNIWTTQAENLIRSYAAALIHQKVLLDSEAAQMCFANAQQEFMALQSQTSNMLALGGIPATDW